MNCLSRITEAMKQRETQQLLAAERQVDPRMVGGFLNRPWGNGGRFYNYRY